MNLLNKVRRFILSNRLRNSKIPLRLWHKTIAKMPLMQRYRTTERMQIRLLASEVLRVKSIVAVQGMELTDEIQTMIATQVAMMVFGLESMEDDLSLDWLRNWQQILVYPTPFHNGRENVLGFNGILLSRAAIESGETQYQGGIVINWQDDHPHPLRAYANQVLMHEMAHKLDMLDGDTNGHPPLHKNMSEKQWFAAFENAFEDLNRRIQHGKPTAINPYAATNPAEFFAVATEYFFEAPLLLYRTYPKVYQQLSLFYKQNPIAK
ncbi:M90 family metallopeptidase [Thiomicrorhabdus immobilis]|nr:M90 family metallopeptidase [Thiomicrorhabdus immobilis]